MRDCQARLLGRFSQPGDDEEDRLLATVNAQRPRLDSRQLDCADASPAPKELATKRTAGAIKCCHSR